MNGLAQIGIALFGVAAIALSQDKREHVRRWACICGLCAQPFWFYTSATNEQWGIFALAFAYTWAWWKGVRTHWLKAKASSAPRAPAQPTDAELKAIAQRHRLRPLGNIDPLPFAREVLALREGVAIKPPLEPTEAMEIAGMRALRSHPKTCGGEFSREQAWAAYRAMQTAAQQFAPAAGVKVCPSCGMREPRHLAACATRGVPVPHACSQPSPGRGCPYGEALPEGAARCSRCPLGVTVAQEPSTEPANSRCTKCDWTGPTTACGGFWFCDCPKCGEPVTDAAGVAPAPGLTAAVTCRTCRHDTAPTQNKRCDSCAVLRGWNKGHPCNWEPANDVKEDERG